MPDEINRLSDVFGNDVIRVVIAIGSWKDYDAEFPVLESPYFLSEDYTDSFKQNLRNL
jgi:hypothetical protein